MKALLFSLLLLCGVMVKANIGQREYAEFVMRPLLVILDTADRKDETKAEYNSAVVRNNNLFKKLMPDEWLIKNPSIQYLTFPEAEALVKASPNMYSVLAFGKYTITVAQQSRDVMALRGKLVGDDLKKSMNFETKFDICSYMFGQWPLDPGAKRDNVASLLSDAVLSPVISKVALERAFHLFNKYVNELSGMKRITDIVNVPENLAKLKTKTLLVPAEYLEINASAIAKDYPNRYDVVTKDNIENKIKLKDKHSAYIDFMFSSRIRREIFIIVDCETGDILASAPMNPNPATDYMAAIQALTGYHFKAFLDESGQLYFY